MQYQNIYQNALSLQIKLEDVNIYDGSATRPETASARKEQERKECSLTRNAKWETQVCTKRN